MPVQTSCPSCKISIRLLDAQPGVPLKCPKCEREWIPTAAEIRQAPPPLPQATQPRPVAPPPIPTSQKKAVVHEPEFLPSDPELSLPERTKPRRADRSPQRQGLSPRTRLFAALGAVGVVLVLGVVAFFTIRAAVQWASASRATSPVASTEPLSGEQVYQRLIRCTVLIVTRDGIGSGFVVSTDKRFVVTNHHVVGGAREVAVVFPLYDDKGELITDARKYESRAKEVAVKGEVIERDEVRDLALIRLERLPPKVEAVTFARKPAPTGSVVYSVGNSGAVDAPGVEGNLLWRLTKGTVRGRVERRTGTTECMILETDAPVNPGDSGGPVVNDRAELVGVVSHFLTRQRQVSGNIDVDELRKFLSPHLKP